MTGGTLGPHGDPDLHHARVAAERALRDRLETAGWDDVWPMILLSVPTLAEIAVDAAWASLVHTISAWRKNP